jgi:hypothetical protein
VAGLGNAFYGIPFYGIAFYGIAFYGIAFYGKSVRQRAIEHRNRAVTSHHGIGVGQPVMPTRKHTIGVQSHNVDVTVTKIKIKSSFRK